MTTSTDMSNRVLFLREMPIHKRLSRFCDQIVNEACNHRTVSRRADLEDQTCGLRSHAREKGPQRKATPTYLLWTRDPQILE